MQQTLLGSRNSANTYFLVLHPCVFGSTASLIIHFDFDFDFAYYLLASSAAVRFFLFFFLQRNSLPPHFPLPSLPCPPRCECRGVFATYLHLACDDTSDRSLYFLHFQPPTPNPPFHLVSLLAFYVFFYLSTIQRFPFPPPTTLSPSPSRIASPILDRKMPCVPIFLHLTPPTTCFHPPRTHARTACPHALLLHAKAASVFFVSQQEQRSVSAGVFFFFFFLAPFSFLSHLP